MKLYEGNKPYIFASYAHKDTDQVMLILEMLSAAGARVWCDTGVVAGSMWSEMIYDHLENCEIVLAFVSKAYHDARSCQSELALANEKSKLIIPIILEDFPIPLGLQLMLGQYQWLFLKTFPSIQALVNTILSRKQIESCLETPEETTPEWDEKLEEALSYALDLGQITVSALQRKFALGYARAARIIDAMEQLGILSESEGSKPRRVLVTREEAERLLAKCFHDSETEPIPEKAASTYLFPPITLLQNTEPSQDFPDHEEVRENGAKILETLKSFRMDSELVQVTCGPAVLRYELVPKSGVRIQRIANIANDITMSLKTSGVRIEAPIPGKAAVGIEVPRRKPRQVTLGSLIAEPDFQNAKSKLTACLGVDVTGAPVFMDLAKMPHLLIGGTLATGKTVCINSIITSLLYRNTPEELKLVLIDPRNTNFYLYENLPHLLIPVITPIKKAVGALASAVNEMERRFELMIQANVRSIKDYNALAEKHPVIQKLPYIVLIIDELADLILTLGDDFEDSIVRLAQKGRAAGIHMILSTQRPSTDTITGNIKANVPSRIAFCTASAVDSRIILDTPGAEKLSGQGDMLYAPIGTQGAIRVQGAYVSDREIASVVEFIHSQMPPISYDEALKASLSALEPLDERFAEAVSLALATGKISTSILQRKLSLGYSRAAHLLDSMENLGIITPADGMKPREILLSKNETEAILQKLGLSLVETEAPAPAKEVRQKPTKKAVRQKTPPASEPESHTPSGIVAYEGDEPYIFVSYAHKDAERVLPVLRELADRGFRLWFDENIETGGKWTMEIMRHVKNCSVFLAFVTQSYANSSFCEREATTAMNKEKTMIALYLERFPEPDWLEFCFTIAQNIDCSRFSSMSAYLDKLTSSTEMLKCRKDRP